MYSNWTEIADEQCGGIQPSFMQAWALRSTMFGRSMTTGEFSPVGMAATAADALLANASATAAVMLRIRIEYACRTFLVVMW